MKSRHGWRLAAAVMLATVTLAGCGAPESTSTAGSSGGGLPKGGDKAAAPAGAQDGGDTLAGAPGQAAPGQAAPPQRDAAQGAPQQGAPGPAEYRREDRSIIRNGTMTVRVADADSAAAGVGSLADGSGGFVAGDKRAGQGDSAEVHLTLRIPADRFMSTVDEIAKLGQVEERSISSEDVTQQVVDLDAQIASQKASVDRTRALLARAQSIGEIVSIEAELAKRESALATLEARKARLADLTSLSTITVRLLGRTAGGVPPPAQDEPSFLAGLRAGWEGFVGAMTVLLAILGFLLPFLLVLGLPVGGLWWVLRRRRRALAPAAATPESPPGVTAATAGS